MEPPPLPPNQNRQLALASPFICATCGSVGQPIIVREDDPAAAAVKKSAVGLGAAGAGIAGAGLGVFGGCALLIFGLPLVLALIFALPVIMAGSMVIIPIVIAIAIPVVIYLSRDTRKKVSLCAACKSAELIPRNTPRGQNLFAQFHGTH